MREHTAGGSHKNGRRLYVKVDGPSSLVLESEVRGTKSSPLQSALDWIYAAGGKRWQDKLCSDSTSKFFISLDVLPVGHRPSTFFETHYWQPFVFSAVARREGILWVEIWVRTNIHAGKQMPSVNWILYGSSQIRHIEEATGSISATNKQDPRTSSTGIAVHFAMISVNMLAWLGSKCWISTKAISVSGDRPVKKSLNASRPPADAPIATMGKEPFGAGAFTRLGSFFGGGCGLDRRDFIFARLMLLTASCRFTKI